jgi:hypothetical protein
MKHSLAFALIAVSLTGCSSRSPYDVSSDQVKRHVTAGMISGKIDLKHLPPGAKKEEKEYKKGDVLPDGTIADSDRKLVRVTIEK